MQHGDHCIAVFKLFCGPINLTIIEGYAIKEIIVRVGEYKSIEFFLS